MYENLLKIDDLTSEDNLDIIRELVKTHGCTRLTMSSKLFRFLSQTKAFRDNVILNDPARDTSMVLCSLSIYLGAALELSDSWFFDSSGKRKRVTPEDIVVYK